MIQTNKQKLFEEFIKNCENSSNVISCVLFGSRSRGDFKENSDYDICLFLENENIDFSYPLKDEGFDIFSFNSLPEIIKLDIFKEGKILVLNNTEKFKLIKKRFLREYRGFEQRRNYYNKRILENV